MLVFTVAFIGFVFAYAGVAGLTKLKFEDTFRLARGVASTALAALGFFALFRFHHAWPSAWVTAEPDALAVSLLPIPVAHFCADFVITAWGRRKHDARPRKDLIVHHALGLFAVSMTMILPRAAPLYLTLFTTEMMPITSAVTALGSIRKDERLRILGMKLRLAVIVCWRFPFWFWITSRIAIRTLEGHAVGDVRAIYGFSAAFLVIMLVLDTIWSRACIRALRRRA